MRKKFIIIIFVCLILNLTVVCQLAFGATPAVEYLCEFGITFYRLGRYDEALTEFSKALILDPENKTARFYIDNIFRADKDSEKAVLAPPAPTVRQKPERRLETKVPPEEISREQEMERALMYLTRLDNTVKEEMRKDAKETGPKYQVAGVRLSGEAQVTLGFSPQDVIWKQANADLDEENWRTLSDAALNRRNNTYDTRVFDRLKVNLDTENEAGFNFHGNITVDPWSFTGRSEKVNVNGPSEDMAQVQLKYWSNTGYTINETVRTLSDGDALDIPEIKVKDNQISTPLSITSKFKRIYTLPPETKIYRQFQPIRELWMDYIQPETFKLRVSPFSYQDQALTTDDPLKLSNNHIWWEESPWLSSWLPGTYNSGASPVDFTSGQWDDSLSFFTRDSDGLRLTALRGFSFDFTGIDNLSFASSVAVPKTLWQHYEEFDNVINANRLKYRLLDSLNLGAVYTYRVGLNEDYKRDSYNHVWGMDLGYEPLEGLKLSLETATSRTKKDLTSPDYATKERGNAYYFSLMGVFPKKPILDLKYGYDEIKPEDYDTFFTKYKFYWAQMDSGFNPSLSSYIETRDDAFWSRHIHFRKPYSYFYSGLGAQSLKWEDVAPFRIGNGIDIGRFTFGLRLENSLWDKKIENLFDVRNVHKGNNKFVENVVREELTYQVTDKLSTKVLGIYNKLPKTTAGYDPLIVDGDTGNPLLNDDILDEKDPSLKTGSLGLEYAFTDWLAFSGIWERTNDYSLGYDNFPRKNLEDFNFSTYRLYDRTYRYETPFLYSQDLFPLPPYHYYNIWKTGLTLKPLDDLEIYLDYTRNEFESAGQMDSNINHIGLEAAYLPGRKFGLYFRYTYSRWNDLSRMTGGYDKYYLGHHNFFGEFKYFPTTDDELILQYGESGRSPNATIDLDPYGGSLTTLDTRHIFRVFYRRKF